MDPMDMLRRIPLIGYAILTFVAVSLWPTSIKTTSINNQIAFLQRSRSSLLEYPASFTQGIVPKAIHSHNDYWRDVPLFTALSYGACSVEADVFLFDNQLLVGHEPAALIESRTFESLYVQSLLRIIKNRNADNRYTEAARAAGMTWGVRGVFETSGDTSLHLLVDIKTEGNITLPFVLDALKPLRDAGYLSTYYPNGTYVSSAITVIGTGNTPFDSVQALSPRDYFFDAPLEKLTNVYNSTNSPIASTNYAIAIGWRGIGNISKAQLAKLTKLVSDGHNLGIQTRFWDTPSWPVEVRNNVWRTLLNNGVDWLNADDLKAASEL